MKEKALQTGEAMLDLQARRISHLIGKVVLYDPRGKPVGNAPKRRIFGVVIGPCGYSAVYGPLVRLGYGPRKASGKGRNRTWMYARTVEVPMFACEEVTNGRNSAYV